MPVEGEVVERLLGFMMGAKETSLAAAFESRYTFSANRVLAGHEIGLGVEGMEPVLALPALELTASVQVHQ